MTKRISNGQTFPTIFTGYPHGAQGPNLYVSHNRGDKSGDSLLTSEDLVFLDVGQREGTRLITYETARALHGFLGNLLVEYDAHQVQAKALEEEKCKEREYKERVASWERTTRKNSINTTSAVQALMSGKTVRLLENVLGDFYGMGWEEYRLDDEGQVMCATSTNPQLHLSSDGPLSKTGKDKRWVTVPFSARPQR